MDVQREIQNLFPTEMRFLWEYIGEIANEIQEIRIRVGQPIILHTGRYEYTLYRDGSLHMIEPNKENTGSNLRRKEECYIFTVTKVRQLFSYLCKNSVYAYTEELKRGYMTVPGGHRVGIAGEMTQIEKDVFVVRQVYYMNIRIARSVIGAADLFLPYLYAGERLQSTLFISPPGYGKTTVLRDAIRQIADGNRWGRGLKVAVVDERMELSGHEDGINQNDLGMRTDVLSGCLKQRGIMMLLRSMGPEVIAVDEIGGEEDLQALVDASHCGCSLLATMHGNNQYDEMMKRKMIPLFENQLFSRYIYLGKQTNDDCRNIILDECGEVINCL